MRLQKFLAEAGFGSRRKCEELISAGRVLLNGRPATMGDVVDPEKDRVKVDDSTVRAVTERIYLAMFKPREVLCSASDARGRRTVYNLLPALPVRVHTVGRLDYLSEGLLLLTNDGDLTRRLTHPSGGIERVYEVKIQGEVAEWAIAKITKGVPLDDGLARASDCKRLRVAETNAWLRVTMAEGRYREVRRMFKAIGFNVLKLKRVRFGPIRLGTLIPGQVRELTAAEVELLMDPDKARKPVRERDEEKSPVPKPRKKAVSRREAASARGDKASRTTRTTGGERPSRGDKAPRGERPGRDERSGRGERSGHDERPARTTRTAGGERPARGDKAPRGERPGRDERPARTTRSAGGERPARADKAPRGERPARGEKPARTARTAGGERPARTTRTAGGERPARGDKAPRGGKAPARDARTGRAGAGRTARPGPVENAPEGVRKLVGQLEKALASEPRDDDGGKSSDGRVRTYTGSRSGYSRTPRSSRTGPSSSRSRGTGGRGSGRNRA